MRFRIRFRNLQRTVRKRISDYGTVLSARNLFRTQFGFENLAQDVPRQDVSFLDAWQIAGGNLKEEVGCLGDLSPTLSSKCNRDGANLARGFEREKDIAAVSRGGDGDHDIPLAREGLDLALEDVFVPVVVAGSGEDRGIGRERNGGNAGAVMTETDDELAIEVLCVGRAAAVAAPEYLAAH